MCQVTDGKGNQRATQRDGTNSAQQKEKKGARTKLDTTNTMTQQGTTVQ